MPRGRGRSQRDEDEDAPSRRILAGYMRQQGGRVARRADPDARDQVTEIDLAAVREAARGTSRRLR